MDIKEAVDGNILSGALKVKNRDDGRYFYDLTNKKATQGNHTPLLKDQVSQLSRLFKTISGNWREVNDESRFSLKKGNNLDMNAEDDAMTPTTNIAQETMDLLNGYEITQTQIKDMFDKANMTLQNWREIQQNMSKKWLTVPLNQKGIEEYDVGISGTDNMKEFELSDAEFLELMVAGVFANINVQCKLLIDEYESEYIDGANIDVAKAIIESAPNKYGVMLEAITLAKEKGTALGIDF